MVIGCGLSLLSEEMHTDGFSNIQSTDYSEEAITIMKARERPGCVYRVMDARALDIPDSSLDAVLDKGTLDAIANMDDGKTECLKMLREVSRVLRPSGKYILITHDVPHDHMIGYGHDGGSRVDILTEDGLDWNIAHEELIQRGKMKFMAYVVQATSK